VKYLFLILITSLYLYAKNTVVANDQDYYKNTQDGVELIYTKKNLPFAKHTSLIESNLHKNYAKYFDWKLDDTLYVGLVSDYNQIANAFSTQFPKNSQINYIGGTEAIDYFSSTSWLDTLLYHETAHNYQVNVKGSAITRSLYSVFGNGFVFFSYLTVPNIMANSFMLEGNAVLNESWHGNGGRLYSGRFKIETILQAKAGNIIASDVYNEKLAFPYKDIHYILGGFYNLYLAEKYGLKAVNSYFKYFSEDFYWPQFTNASMKKSIGIDFETSLKEFSDTYAKLADDVVLVHGKKLYSSQMFYPLSNDKDEIYFIANKTGVSVPELVVLDKNSLNMTKSKASYISGKVIKHHGEYFTQSGSYVSADRIYQGLFNSEGFIQDNTKSKNIQGYLSDGEAVYFDVESSYSQAQLYVGEKFYAQVNSSVIIDKDDNVYYFVQNAKSRTLYKNHQPLYTYQGFYGIPSDVDSQGNVYFVANSENGSTLYCYKEGKVTRASSADNIVEARMLNDNEIFIAAINDKEYYYLTTKKEMIELQPFETKLFFENEDYYAGTPLMKKEDIGEVNLSHKYKAILDMHYSGADLNLGVSKQSSVGYLGVNFADPLSQNFISIFLFRDDSYTTVAGLVYTNKEYRLAYSLTGYRVADSPNLNYMRDYGVIVGASLPYFKKGYYLGALYANYYQDYNTLREPLSLTLAFSRFEKFGFSMYSNYINSLSLYVAREREDFLYGGKYGFYREISHELYAGIGFKYSATDNKIETQEAYRSNKGVKVTSTSYQADKDPTTILMANLDSSIYVKKAGFAQINLSKVLHFSSYWFTFPVSLQRESLYTRYRHYNLKSFSDRNYTANEIKIGFSLSTIFFNKSLLPLNFEYVYNDASFIKSKNKFLFTIGAAF